MVANWNGRDLLASCLGSVQRQTYHPVECILVDDGSTDASIDLVRRDFPNVRVVVHARNRGFAAAANTGITRARGDIIALLNTDAVADPTWLAELVAALDRHPTAGSVASKMLLDEPEPRLHSAGDVFQRDGIPGSRGVWQRDLGQYDEETLVFSACGGAAAYRRLMLDDIGLFDERFFMYCEDMDLAFRAQMRGYECVYAPQAVVRHRLGGTASGEMAAYLCGRNFVWLLARDVPATAWARDWAAMVRAQARISREALHHIREPAAQARIRGQLAGLLSVGRFLGERGSLDRRRRVPESYLVQKFT